jgi:uroporphyrinogen decarboxylase
MTPRENLIRVLRREGYSEVPFDILLSPAQVERFRCQTGENDVEAYFRLQHRTTSIELEPYADPSLFFAEPLPEGTRFDSWGVAHTPGSAAAMHMTRQISPLAGDVPLTRIVDYPLPVLANEDPLKKCVENVHESGYATVGQMAQTIWETAWAIRSMEDLMIDMMSGDERATVLLDRVTEVAVARAAAYARAGCDIVHLGDDIGMQRGPMMSLELWRDWLKPRLDQVIRAAREERSSILILYHSCGFIEPFLDDLTEIGVQIINPVQPESMTLSDIHEHHGARLSFWGTIGTQTTLPFGTPEEVRSEVLRNVEIAGEAGGLVVAPTHLVEPEVPFENIVALRDAVDEASASK